MTLNLRMKVIERELQGWRPLRIGAGGYVTQLDVVDDGGTTKVIIGTDTRGAFLWDSVAEEWIDLLTYQSMPTDEVDANTSQGGYGVAIAPSDPDTMYVSYNPYVYVTDDNGVSWTRTDFPSRTMDANDQTNIQRVWQRRIAVDPVDEDHVLAGAGGSGSDGGLWRSTNGGVNFTELTALPTPSAAGVTGILFDHNSSLVSGRTGTVYACINGTGVYRSTDAGATWSALSGGPSGVMNAMVSEDGDYFCTEYGGTVWQYSSGWTDITPSVENRDWHTILVDPADTDRWICFGGGAYISQSTNAGSTWGSIDFADKTRVANDIPWLAWTLETYMSVGGIMWDPNVTNQCWFAQGIGVWTFSYPSSPASPLVMTSHSEGIEQLIATDIVSPAEGVVVTGSWDRPIFYSDDQDVFPSTHGPDRSTSINHCWSLAVDPQNASRLVACVNYGENVLTRTGYSADGGESWTEFSADPYTNAWGGSVCVNGPDNVLIVDSGDPAYYSNNNGVSWTAVTLPGAGWVGKYGDLHGSTYMRRKIFAADPGDADTFYMYACHPDEGATATLSGIYKTVNGGATWTHTLATVFGGTNLSYWNCKLKAVPGQTDPAHLVWTNGDVSGSEAGSLYYSNDGGATWDTYTDVLEAKDFGFCAAAPGESYPAMMFAGWLDGVWGFWRTDDPTDMDCAWTNIGTHPHDWIDQIVCVAGDPVIHNRWYVGWLGGGFSYYGT